MIAITYSRQGDYFLPNLTVPEESQISGKYALLRRTYLIENHYGKFLNLLTQGKLNQHLLEIQQSATSRMEQLVKEMAKAQNINEQLKVENQMEWVGRMNNIRNAAEEIVLKELIYN